MYIEKIEKEIYHIKQGTQQIGSFRLIDLGNNKRKLKSLKMIENVSPVQILGVFELIQVYAKEEGISEIHVTSHAESLDNILKYQHFIQKDVEKNLWIYEVINR
ncbi:hypothetical protein [Halobacillus sp. BBL2006]|uniref:hypothetical protein n=1 Tax=Halobacillus sp. BBL2006 TaxID=1543706 RepID=UPI000541D2D5|nr:hypothetical protein [Halobacillus sp. BBL2006]KHE69209.1 hypothetical protein LD39_13300 [Halobacillus sp. BBL2006]